MSASLDHSDSVFDLNMAVPETQLLDSSLQKGRAQLSVKAGRQRPSRSRYHGDSLSSTEGEEGLDRKDSPMQSSRSPLHLAMRGSSPSPDSLLSSRSPAFSFDTSLGRRSPEDSPLIGPPRGRYSQLTNATSQEALAPPPGAGPAPNPLAPPPGAGPAPNSPLRLRRSRRPDSEVLVSETRDASPDGSGPDGSGPEGPGSPTVVFDKKTKRRFLDLGVTLRRSYIRVRKDKSSRLSVGSRDPSESPARSSGSLVSFSWFSEGRGPPGPPGPPHRSCSQESALSEEFSPPQPCTSSPPVDSSRSSHPYQTLSQSSDEPGEDPPCSSVASWTPQEVCQWLRGLNMERYVPEFESQEVNGEQLLQLDGSRLKGLGVLSSADRGALKRRLRDVQAAAQKEKKALDKLERRRDKQRRRAGEEGRS